MKSWFRLDNAKGKTRDSSTAAQAKDFCTRTLMPPRRAAAGVPPAAAIERRDNQWHSLALRQARHAPSRGKDRIDGRLDADRDGKPEDGELRIERQHPLRRCLRFLVPLKLRERRRHEEVTDAEAWVELHRAARHIERILVALRADITNRQRIVGEIVEEIE